ncbi:hypothetical protein [Streptomyces sp. UG1]
MLTVPRRRLLPPFHCLGRYSIRASVPAGGGLGCPLRDPAAADVEEDDAG